MSNSTSAVLDRVLVLAPTANDSSVAVEVLRAHMISAVACSSVTDLREKIEEGCSAVVLAQEALTSATAPQLNSVFRNQEPWSDLPVVLLTGDRAQKIFDAFSSSGNISVLERPFSRADFVSAVEVAIRARQKQYLAKQLMEEQRVAATKRDEFLATLSHELRTPLNVILGWTEILLSGHLPPDAQRDALKILDRNARVQKSLIDDLLDTSRIITGKLYLELKAVSLKRILQSIHDEYALLTLEKQIRFTVDLPAGDCLVWADDLRLSQVFTNLVTNAIKFTPREGSIVIALKRLNGVYRVAVSDSGQGMDPEFLPHVFDRLKQEDMSTTRNHGGLGLGLSITSHIVEAHEGQIQVSSAGRNKGSEFIVTLPVYEGKDSVAATTSASSAVLPDNLRGIKILVVDDSADIRQLIELWLRKTKAEVKSASSGEEGLKALATYRPDIILSDIGMPGMDGYEFIQRVRSGAFPELAAVPAAALTAYAKDEERARAIEAGFQSHISKPISNSDLVTAVSSLLSSARG